MKTSVKDLKFRKVNQLVLSAFLVLAIFSFLSMNGLATAYEGSELLGFTIPSASQMESISPDVHFVKLLLRFAENIITLNF